MREQWRAQLGIRLPAQCGRGLLPLDSITEMFRGEETFLKIPTDRAFRIPMKKVSIRNHSSSNSHLHLLLDIKLKVQNCLTKPRRLAWCVTCSWISELCKSYGQSHRDAQKFAKPFLHDATFGWGIALTTCTRAPNCKTKVLPLIRPRCVPQSRLHTLYCCICKLFLTWCLQ